MSQQTKPYDLRQHSDTVKPCIRCGGVIRYKSGACKACSRRSTRRWQDSHKENGRRSARKWSRSHKLQRRAAKRVCWLRSYGLTVQEYDRMLIESFGRCSICEKEFRNVKIDRKSVV
jgi:hypothetical protein